MSRLARRVGSAFVLAFALGASPHVALGAPATPGTPEDTTEQARIYFDAAAQAYSAGRYPVAIEAFAAAYRLVPRPAILFSMAQAERKQFWIDKKPDGLAHAVQHYREYLAKVPDGGRRDDAATALSELEPAQARLAGAPVDVASGTVATATRLLLSSRATNARASIDGGPPAPLPRLVELPPGAHHLALSADGYYEDARDVAVLPGVTTAVELNLREQPALLDIVAEAGATVYVDGRAVGELPTTQPFEASSGPHKIIVAKNGRLPFQQDVTLERGVKRHIVAPMVVTRQRPISEVVMGVGGASLVLAGVFLGVAYGNQATAQDVLTQKGVSNITNGQLAQYNSALSARDGWRTASLATATGGLAVFLAGGALFLFDHPTIEGAQHASDSPQPPPLLGPAGCGCSVEVSALPFAGPSLGGAAIVGRF